MKDLEAIYLAVVFGPPTQGEGVQICPPPSPTRTHTPCGGVPRMQKLCTPLSGALGYQSFSLSNPAEGWNIALHAVPAHRASAFPDN